MDDHLDLIAKMKSEPMDSDETRKNIQGLVEDDYEGNLDRLSQHIINPSDFGILGNILMAYDQMNNGEDQPGQIEFVIGYNENSYVVTVRRIDKLAECKDEGRSTNDDSVPVEMYNKGLSENVERNHQDYQPTKIIGKEIIQLDIDNKRLIEDENIIIETVNKFNNSQVEEEEDQSETVVENVEVMLKSEEDIITDTDEEESTNELGNNLFSDDVVSSSEVVTSDSDESEMIFPVISNNRKSLKCKECPFTTYSNCRMSSHVSLKHKGKCKEESEDIIKKHDIRLSNKTNNDRNNVSNTSRKALKNCKLSNKVTKSKVKQKRIRKRDKALEEFLDLLNNGTKMIEPLSMSSTFKKDSDKTKTGVESADEENCTFCDFKCSDRTVLYRHIGLKHVHNPNEHFTKGKLRTDCIFCSFKGVNRKNLLLHLRTKHHGGKVYECDQCKYRTHHKSNFDRHVEVVHDKKRDVKCEECGFLTTRNYLLDEHILYKHKGIKPYRCTEPGCNFGSTSSSNRKAHIMEVHKGLKPLVCSVENCNFATSRRFILKSHLYKEHGIGEQPSGGAFNINTGEESATPSFQCPHCSHKASQKGNLQKHIRVKHLGQIKRYKCAECDFSASEKCFVKRHISEVHLGQYSFACDLCHFKCSVRQRFDRHYNAVHMGQRPYMCDFCDYKATQSIHLQRHIEVVHKGEKPHFCVYCKFNTAHRANLRAHLKAIHKVSDQQLREVLLSCIDLRVKKKRGTKTTTALEEANIIQQLQPIAESEFLEQGIVQVAQSNENFKRADVMSEQVHQQSAIVTVLSIPNNSVDNIGDLDALEASLVLENNGQHQSLAFTGRETVSLVGVEAVQNVILEQPQIVSKMPHKVLTKTDRCLPTLKGPKIIYTKQQIKKALMSQEFQVVTTNVRQINSR